MINEITPTDDDSLPTIDYSKIFEGAELERKIHNFFERHIERSFENPKLKNLKFSNYNSTIMNSSKALSGITPTPDDESDIDFFIRHGKIVTKKLAENIHKNVTNPFLFIILDFTYKKDGKKIELLCFIKMEKFFGVQFTDQNLKLHPDMLPDVKTDLQKCAFIYKSKIENLTEDDFKQTDATQTNEKADFQDTFHSKILDRQDESISKYFMTSFMESYIIAQDKEITRLASNHITTVLQKYLKDGKNKSDIKKYLDNELQKRKDTSVKYLVDDIVKNSKFISNAKITSSNLDSDKLALMVYKKMKEENDSAYQEFTSTPDLIKRTTITDSASEGRDVRISFSKMYEDQGVIEFDESQEDIVTLSIQKSRITIKR